MTGSSAFRRTWRQTTTRSRSPLARAVRTKSSWRISSVDERVIRAVNAAIPSPSAMAGPNVIWRFVDGSSQK